MYKIVTNMVINLCLSFEFLNYTKTNLLIPYSASKPYQSCSPEFKDGTRLGFQWALNSGSARDQDLTDASQ